MVEKNFDQEKEKMIELIRNAFLKHSLNSVNYDDFNKAIGFCGLESFVSNFKEYSTVDSLQDIYATIGVLDKDDIIPNSYLESNEFNSLFCFSILPIIFDNNTSTDYNEYIKKEFWTKIFYMNKTEENQEGKINNKFDLLKILSAIFVIACLSFDIFNISVSSVINDETIKKKTYSDEKKNFERMIYYVKNKTILVRKKLKTVMPDYKRRTSMFRLVKRLFTLIHEELGNMNVLDVLEYGFEKYNKNPFD